MKQFEVLDISGDVGLRIFGESLKELFINAAVGFYSLITNTDVIDKLKTVTMKVTGESLEGLLVAWLNELVFFFDTDGFIGKTAKINKLDKNILEAEVIGEDFNLDKHESDLLIKAATYHNIKIEKEDGLWIAEVILDI